MFENDLESLKRLLEGEQAAASKCDRYANLLTDPEIQELLSSLAQEHRARAKALFAYLSK